MGLEQSREEDNGSQTVPEQKKGLRGNTNPSNRSTYIAVPYIKGLSKSAKTFVRSMAFKYSSKEAKPSKNFWWHPKTEISSLKRVASFTGTSVIGWSAMMSI